MVLEPDRREIARYLGYHGITPDAAMQEEIELCVARLQQAVTPRFVYEKFAVSVDSGQSFVKIANIPIHSKHLAANLEGCCAAYLMAVTLGPAPDRLVKRASVERMSRALILQAAAAAMAELLCDEINARILREAAKEGLRGMRRRFSPGYGDLPLEMQREVCAVLNMPKEIGVSLTDTLLMTPSKSVTAIVGVAAVDDGSCGAGVQAAEGGAGMTEAAQAAAGFESNDAHAAAEGGHGCAYCSLAETCVYRG